MSERGDHRPIDRFIPWMFPLFFAVVLAANGTLVYFAAASWTGIETKQHYVKGLDYNRALEGAAAQKRLGWRAALDLKADGGRQALLTVRMSRADGSPLAGVDLVAKFIRPTHQGYDFEVRLAHQGRGLYTGRAEIPLKGQWDIKILAIQGQSRFQQTERRVLK